MRIKNNTTNKKKKHRVSKYNKMFIFGVIVTIIMTKSLFSQGAEDYKDNQSNESPIVYNKKTVLIDPGHGGSDVGTYNPRTGTFEKNINLSIAQKVIKELSKYNNIEVITTRTKDTFVSLSDRNKIERESNSDIFVSIHCNATPDGKSNADGLEIFYGKEDDSKSNLLAQKIHESITSSLDVRDRGIKFGDYKVLRDSKIPSILIESGFLTSDHEEKKLLDENYQYQLAKAIADGIIKYINEDIN